MDRIEKDGISGIDLLHTIGSNYGFEGIQVWPVTRPHAALGNVAVPSADVQLNLFVEPHPELFDNGGSA